MADRDRLHRSKARSWAWKLDTEPTMKLVLLAVARTGDVAPTREIQDLTGVTDASLERTFAKLEEEGLLDEAREVLAHGVTLRGVRVRG